MSSFAKLLRKLAAWVERRGEIPDPPDRLERTEECECGQVLPVSEAHLIVDTEADPESGGGWIQTAAYCPEHCPGGCNQEDQHDHAHP